MFRSLVRAASVLCSLGTILLTFQSNAQAADPATAPAIVNVSIDDTKVISTVGEDFHGTNEVCFWNNTGDGPGTVKAFSQMGMKLLRFPGGVPCHWYDWQRAATPDWKDVTDQQAWNIAKAAGAKLLLQTNIARNDRTIDKKTGKEIISNNTGDYQAGWLNFAKQRGLEVAYWEVGNEPEMDAPGQYKKTQDRIMNWYNLRYDDQARAFRKVDPQARILGPASTNAWFWWHEKNLEKFLAAHGDKQGTGLADIVSLHWYTDTGSRPWEQIRGAPQGWEGCMTYIKDQIHKYDTRDLPVFITEWNFGGGMDTQSCRWLSTALGNADIAGEFLKTGVKAHTHFCLHGTNTNWGILAMKGQSADEGDPAPSYFSLAMASKLWGDVLDTRADADPKNILTAYAARDGHGVIQLMVINKASTPETVALNFKQYQPSGKKISIYRLQGDKGTTRDVNVIYNGVASPKPNKEALPPPEVKQAGDHFTLDLPAFSMAVVSFEGAGEPASAGKPVLPAVRAPVRDLPVVAAVVLPPITPVPVPHASGKVGAEFDSADWKNIHPLPSPFAKTDTSSVQLCWAEDGLHGRAEVKIAGDIKIDKDSPWKGDCLEVFVEKDAARNPDPGRASAQYVFFPNPEKGAGPANARIAYGTMADRVDKLQCNWKPVEGGYVMEFFVPSDVLTPAVMKEGTKLGFNFSLNRAGKPMEQFYSDKNKDAGYATPSTWGMIVLEGSH